MWNTACSIYPFLYQFKIPKCILYRFHLLWCGMLSWLFQLLHSIRCIIHWQSQSTPYFCYVGSMHLKPLLFPNIILNHRICNFFFWFILLCLFCNIIQRNLVFTLTKLHFYIDMSIWFFVRKKNNRLHVHTRRKHIHRSHLRHLIPPLAQILHIPRQRR